MYLTANEREVRLSNLTKVFWPARGYTKGDMINYYLNIYPYINEYLQGRPLTLNVYPDGIRGHSFYQKNCPGHAPDWISTVPFKTGPNGNVINYVVINKLADLLWVANSASIELHTWFSTVRHPDHPDFAVFDLDPGENTTFTETIEITGLIKEILDQLQLVSYIKTSGQRGLHIFIPVRTSYSYGEIKTFLKTVAETVKKMRPEKVTLKWRKKKRRGKLYLDYRQNGRGKTIPSPYSLRPTPEATVSTPLDWSEVNYRLDPAAFNLDTVLKRLNKQGDIWSDLFTDRQSLPEL